MGPVRYDREIFWALATKGLLIESIKLCQTRQAQLKQVTPAKLKGIMNEIA